MIKPALCEERAKTVELFRDTLLEWDIVDENMITLIERGCHSLTIDIANEESYIKNFGNLMFLTTYSQLAYKLLHNLKKDTNNRALIDKLISSEIAPLSLAESSAELLFPEHSAKIRENIELRKQQKVQKALSHLETCSKCKGTITTKKISQTRCADEGSTESIHCENCGHTWRRS
jgi:DNA-directed RNA polymerase subunit M/transcription elongation factor TFIIS